mmetsp:Transcript_16925/g.23211  ORF Transcript_16925/g.23211 Transcript_16925/m.23211 type:complete len:441 (-) Transcript_16925:58-1380(-)
MLSSPWSKILLLGAGCPAFLITNVSCFSHFGSSVQPTARTRLYHSLAPSESDHDDGGCMSRRDALAATVRTTALAAAGWCLTPSGLIIPPAAEAAEGSAIETPTAPKVPVTQLGKGTLSVSRTIQGYWQLAGGHGRYDENDAIQNMKAHFDAGITTLDTADIYGPSELVVGKFAKGEPNAIPCTKFCCFRYLEDIDKQEVRTRINRARERLQTKTLPLVQFFWSNYNVKRYLDVALMLTELKEEGLIQEIGVTNFDLKRLKEFKAAGVPIVSNQVQLSAIDQRPVQSGMTDWCANNDVSLIAFGTVGSGILSERYLGKPAPTQEEKNTASMRMYSATASRFGDWKLVQELLKTMDTIASDVRSSGRCSEANLSNIAQRYVLDTKAVASVLIGVRNQAHISENVRTHSFELTSSERDAISAVVAKRKGPKGDVWDIERGVI